MNGIVSLMSFSMCLSLAHMKSTAFNMLILSPATLLKALGIL